MRKILFSVAALFTFGAANAQEPGFALGLHLGIPMGDAKDFTSINYGVDLAYMFPVAESFSLGIASGYTNYGGKNFEYETYIPPFAGMPGISQIVKEKGKDVGYIPLAAAARYSLTENFFVGLDLGYAFYVGDLNYNGGLYYQPKVGYDFMPFEVFIAYKGIGDEDSFGSFGVGAAYKF